jgi:hypothetical protein
MQELADNAGFWLFLVTVLVVLFFLPTLVALVRRTDGLALVLLVNLIGAPTLILWPAAMILACGPRRPPRVDPASEAFVVADPATFWIPCSPGSRSGGKASG